MQIKLFLEESSSPEIKKSPILQSSHVPSLKNNSHIYYMRIISDFHFSLYQVSQLE